MGLHGGTNSNPIYGDVEYRDENAKFQMSTTYAANTRKLVPTQAETAVAHRKRHGSTGLYPHIQHLEAAALLRCPSKPSLGNEDESM